MIVHEPLVDTEKVCKLYSEKDGVPVTYVCTTDLGRSDLPVNVFFRETPHPDFGNRYFGLYYAGDGHLYIINADSVESLEFGMVEDGEGNLHYSKCHHDFKYIPGKEDLFEVQNSVFIDGGRKYVRVGGNPPPKVYYYKVENGEFVEQDTVAES
jgi:hypothetical protein